MAAATTGGLRSGESSPARGKKKEEVRNLGSEFVSLPERAGRVGQRSSGGLVNPAGHPVEPFFFYLAVAVLVNTSLVEGQISKIPYGPIRSLIFFIIRYRYRYR
jgi:hypothetical protein